MHLSSHSLLQYNANKWGLCSLILNLIDMHVTERDIDSIGVVMNDTMVFHLSFSFIAHILWNSRANI
jgi:hypothetical protein